MSAVKHQQASYRTHRGRRLHCWMDVMESPEGLTLQQAAAEVCREFRAAGHAAKYETHPDGFVRVFTNAPSEGASS